MRAARVHEFGATLTIEELCGAHLDGPVAMTGVDVRVTQARCLEGDDHLSVTRDRIRYRLTTEPLTDSDRARRHSAIHSASGRDSHVHDS